MFGNKFKKKTKMSLTSEHADLNTDYRQSLESLVKFEKIVEWLNYYCKKVMIARVLLTP